MLCRSLDVSVSVSESPVGPMAGSGDSMMPTDPKLRAEHKEEGSTPTTEPPKPKVRTDPSPFGSLNMFRRC